MPTTSMTATRRLSWTEVMGSTEKQSSAKAQSPSNDFERAGSSMLEEVVWSLITETHGQSVSTVIETVGSPWC